MTKSEKSRLLRLNTIYWLAAIVVPVVLHFGLSSTKFPWPVILPLLLVGPMLASNSLVSKASGAATHDSSRRESAPPGA
jgi:hypothetical protein